MGQIKKFRLQSIPNYGFECEDINAKFWNEKVKFTYNTPLVNPKPKGGKEGCKM